MLLHQHRQLYGSPRNIICALAILVILWRLTRVTTPSAVPVIEIHIPQKLWQIWKTALQDVGDEYKQFTTTWFRQNPDYRYELVHDGALESFVEHNFRRVRPDVADTFIQVKDTILKADYSRYLVLLAEGGTYSDMDTECSRPIRSWIPENYVGKAGLVIGIEYDALNKSIGHGFKYHVQFGQWAMMAAPGNPVLRHVVDRVTAALQSLAKQPGGSIRADTNFDVLATTGPQIFTHAILEHLSVGEARNYTSEDFTGLTEPRLVKDVLILPISAFGSGIPHSGAKEVGNEDQLLRHHFRGNNGGWKSGVH